MSGIDWTALANWGEIPTGKPILVKYASGAVDVVTIRHDVYSHLRSHAFRYENLSDVASYCELENTVGQEVGTWR